MRIRDGFVDETGSMQLDWLFLPLPLSRGSQGRGGSLQLL